jgi:methanogenic corrinoid protein MtbC1
MDPSGQNAGGGQQWQDRWEDQWADNQNQTGGAPPGQGPGRHTSSPPRPKRQTHDARDAGRDRAQLLNQMLERAVIPRLVLQQGPSSAVDPAGGVAVPGSWLPANEDVTALAAMVLVREPAFVIEHVEALRLAGASLETIYLDLLAPAARTLGDMWTDDVCDFTQVTMGVWCLHQILHSYSHVFQSEGRPTEANRHILLAPAPGEQHTFGMAMVAEFFRRDGWQVSSGMQASVAELVELVRDNSFSVVGLSVGCGTRMEPIGQCIRQLRKASRNSALGILIGGPIFSENPELARFVGADATANDGRHATHQAARLLALLSPED